MNTDPYLVFLAFAGQDDYSGESVASVLICAAGRVQRLVSPQPVAR